MASNTITGASQYMGSREEARSDSPARYLVPLGRLFFSAILLLSGPRHFTEQSIGYAAHSGVPMANVLVPTSGILAALAGLSILLGYRAKVGAWLAVFFLVPVTFAMHNFWATTDPMMYQMQFAHFMKNIAMIGAALMITQMGPGAVSFDERR